MNVHLTDELAQAYQPEKADECLWDSEVPGFALRVRDFKRRTWAVYYRLPNGKQGKPSLGPITELTAAKARRMAARIVEEAKNDGIDATAERRAKKQAAKKERFARRLAEQRRADQSRRTFSVVVTEFLSALDEIDSAEPDRRSLAPTYRKSIQSYLEGHFGALAKQPIREITRLDVGTALKDIKKARGPISALRARSALSKFFKWSLGEGYCDDNPVVGTNPPAKTRRRKRVLTDSELSEIWGACEGEFGDIVRLLMLTLQRRTEVSGMSADEVAEAENLWTLPEVRTKNKRLHAVPLAPGAAQLLKPILKRRNNRRYLFGERESSFFSGWSKGKRELDARILEKRRAADPEAEGLVWTLHDLRRTGRTWMGNNEVAPWIGEAVLNHTAMKSGSEAPYDYAQYLTEKRAALDLWAEHVTSLVEASR